jgi:hypothetical protein
MLAIHVTKHPFTQDFVHERRKSMLKGYVNEPLPGQIVENISFYDVRNLCSALTSVVNVQGDDGHRARERDEADRHAVVQACNNV